MHKIAALAPAIPQALCLIDDPLSDSKDRLINGGGCFLCDSFHSSPAFDGYGLLVASRSRRRQVS
jgi:hypothetical protein